MKRNIIRARRAERCLKHYRFLSGDDLKCEQTISDLVADIGHYCVEHDLAYQYLLARGISHWRFEMTDPESLGAMPEVTININESHTNA